MTEAEWDEADLPGRMLDHIKRAVRLSPRSRARKFRLVAVAFLRHHPETNRHADLVAVLNGVERSCDSGGRLPPFPPGRERPPWQADHDGSPEINALRAIESLLTTESYSAAYDVAGRTLPVGHVYLRDRPQTPHAGLLRDIFGNPFRPVAFDPSWRSSSAVGVAASMYESRDFSPMPILADALEDAGCDDADVLAHCRGDGPHVRGCWVVDLVLGKA